MHNESYVRAVVAERVRARELALHDWRLHCVEPKRIARRMRFSFAWFPRLVTVKPGRNVAPGAARRPTTRPTSTPLG
jgi:hypothetical protein